MIPRPFCRPVQGPGFILSNRHNQVGLDYVQSYLTCRNCSLGRHTHTPSHVICSLSRPHIQKVEKTKQKNTHFQADKPPPPPKKKKKKKKKIAPPSGISMVIGYLLRRQLLLWLYLGTTRVRIMIGFLVQGWVKIKIRIRIRVRVMFNISIYHRSNCHRSKCRTFMSMAVILRPEVGPRLLLSLNQCSRIISLGLKIVGVKI